MVTFSLPLAAKSGGICDGVVELELAGLVELHDGGGGGEDLGERGHVEDGVFGHGLGGGGFAVEAGFAGEFAEAVGLLEDDLPLWPMRTTAPGSLLAAMAVLMRVVMGVKSWCGLGFGRGGTRRAAERCPAERREGRVAARRQ